LTSGHLTPF